MFPTQQREPANEDNVCKVFGDARVERDAPETPVRPMSILGLRDH